MEPGRILFLLLASVLAHIVSGWVPASAVTTHMGTPSNYRGLLRGLKPGDHLQLAPGNYKEGLPVHHLHGTPDAPITISGSSEKNRPVFLAQPHHNTISILNSSYIVLRDLEIEGNNLPVNGVKCEGHADWAHHITLEGLRVRGHGNNQQTVAISTKCPAWNWIIRNNIIEGAGTGLYLGNSDGRAPFVAGLIEHNLIVDTIGYNLQIKHQAPRPALPGMPHGHNTTIIRHNVFSKISGGAGAREWARPNVLVGHWPLTGPGSNDLYLIYGNFFYQNPHESLFQGEGNIALYNNVFVNHLGDAIHIQPHNGTPRAISVFYNTVIARDTGISLSVGKEDLTDQHWIEGNAIFARPPLAGYPSKQNLVGGYQAAGEFLVKPFAPLGQMNLALLPGKWRFPPIDSGRLRPYLDSEKDFDGAVEHVRFGAYANIRSKPERWMPKLEIKPEFYSAKDLTQK